MNDMTDMSFSILLLPHSRHATSSDGPKPVKNSETAPQTWHRYS
jgi:hypothetical protein